MPKFPANEAISAMRLHKIDLNLFIGFHSFFFFSEQREFEEKEK